MFVVDKLFDQEKTGSAVLALGGDSFFIDPVDEVRADAAAGVLAGDDIAVRVTVETQSDLFDLMIPAREFLDGVFQQVSDDRDVVFHGQQEILFQAPAVRGHREQDSKLRRVHHLSDDQGTDL